MYHSQTCREKKLKRQNRKEKRNRSQVWQCGRTKCLASTKVRGLRNSWKTKYVRLEWKMHPPSAEWARNVENVTTQEDFKRIEKIPGLNSKQRGHNQRGSSHPCRAEAPFRRREAALESRANPDTMPEQTLQHPAGADGPRTPAQQHQNTVTSNQADPTSTHNTPATHRTMNALAFQGHGTSSHENCPHQAHRASLANLKGLTP